MGRKSCANLPNSPVSDLRYASAPADVLTAGIPPAVVLGRNPKFSSFFDTKVLRRSPVSRGPTPTQPGAQTVHYNVYFRRSRHQTCGTRIFGDGQCRRG